MSQIRNLNRRFLCGQSEIKEAKNYEISNPPLCMQNNMALGLLARIHGIKVAPGLASSVEFECHEDATVNPFAKFASRLVFSDE